MPAPTVDGATAIYGDVLPGVDLRLTATAAGMSQVLVVANATAAAQPGLANVAFEVAGATLRDSAGGTTSATTAFGDQILSPTPTWWDSRDGGTADAPGGPVIPRPIDPVVSSDQESMPIGDLLASSDVSYPAFIDPDFSDAQQGRTFVDAAYPDVSYWNGNGASDAYQHVGYIDAAHVHDDGRDHVTRSMWQMKTNLYFGRSIVSAKFNADLDYSSSCAPRVVTLLSAGAISSGTAWNNQPPTFVKQSEINDAAGYPGCGAKTLGFDATEAVTYASNNATPSLVFELAANESDWLAWKKFGADVTLVVTYYTTPTVPRVWDTECHRSPGLLVNDRLLAGQVRYSLGGTYALVMQTDGNLVLYPRKHGVQLVRRDCDLVVADQQQCNRRRLRGVAI